MQTTPSLEKSAAIVSRHEDIHAFLTSEVEMCSQFHPLAASDSGTHFKGSCGLGAGLYEVAKRISL
jgi:hypothetical protein